MKFSQVVCLFPALLGLALAAPSEWQNFKSKHNKSYENPLEDSLRHAIYETNRQEVDRFNLNEALKAGYYMKLNHLSDRTDKELAQMRGAKVPAQDLANSPNSQKFLDEILNSGDDLPESVDWTKVPGRVTPIKNQGPCGSCWAFATIGTLEGQMVAHNRSLVSLSEENMIDCSESNEGCEGGWPLRALDDLKSIGGLESEADYPYRAVQGRCKFDKSKAAFSANGGALLKEGDEEMLKKVIAKFGPVAVAIDASQESFRFYSSGVYYERRCRKSSGDLDHAVLIVGYGTDEQQRDYWLVKNSWGEGWGDKGFIRMARNKGNSCGIATRPTIPTF